MRKISFTYRNCLVIVLVLSVCLYSCKPRQPKEVQDLRKFIKENWKNTVRSNINDSAGLIGLPKPYTVPSVSGIFQEMYYWDIYFVNIGLILDGDVTQAINNVDNMIYLVDKYGFMPNGNRFHYLNNSQPPYLSMMIRDIYEKTNDKAWLKTALPVLEKEYAFWMTKRITPVGLNRFSNHAPDSLRLSNFKYIATRLGKNFNPAAVAKNDSDKIRIGSHFYAEYESGWDFSPRFDSRCEDFCPLDLNCNLYMYELNFDYFYKELGLENNTKWLELAEKRKALINKYLYNPNDNLFYDYDFVNNKLSPVYSAAIMNFLWSKMATAQQAQLIQKSLPRLEFKFGISTCEPGPRTYSYQWDYPNGWASLQYLTIKGLLDYGYNDDAKRVAEKYVNLLTTTFAKSNNLWEKYNIVNGSLEVTNEYEMPTMLDWTAGVFVYASDFLYR